MCLAAPVQASWLRQNGCDPLRERSTLSSWPWETQQWPDAWLPLLEVADELWPYSRFTAAALTGPTADAGRPLQVMPMAAEIAEPERLSGASARAAVRSRHGLPGEAFQRAFPLQHLPAPVFQR